MLKQNPERYSTAGGEVLISASPNRVEPLRIPLADELEILPLLEADGVIVECGGVYIASPKTLEDLRTARMDSDPHLWFSPNGSIRVGETGSAATARTIPLIRVDITGLETAAEAQGFALRTAGVTEIQWSFSGSAALPEGVLKQINWTLAAAAERPVDRWRLAGLGLGADYSYETLQIAPPAEGGRIDYAAIGEIVRRVGERLNELRGDFNRIGDLYFDGVIPDGAGESDLFESAITEVPPAGPDPNRQRVRKETRVVDYTPAGGTVSAIAGGAATGATPTPPPADPIGGNNPPAERRRISPLTPILGLLFGRRRG